MNLLDYIQGGVAIFAISALVYVVKIFMCVIKNHIHESTQVSQKLSDTITHMHDLIERKL